MPRPRPPRRLLQIKPSPVSHSATSRLGKTPQAAGSIEAVATNSITTGAAVVPNNVDMFNNVDRASSDECAWQKLTRHVHRVPSDVINAAPQAQPQRLKRWDDRLPKDWSHIEPAHHRHVLRGSRSTTANNSDVSHQAIQHRAQSVTRTFGRQPTQPTRGEREEIQGLSPSLAQLPSTTKDRSPTLQAPANPWLPRDGTRWWSLRDHLFGASSKPAKRSVASAIPSLLHRSTQADDANSDLINALRLRRPDGRSAPGVVRTRTAQRLQRGHRVSVRLDLHGETGQHALALLQAAVKAHPGQTLLVITGYGRNVVRSLTHRWLHEQTVDPHGVVLAWHTAKPHDGGAAAIYVLCRQSKS